MRSSTKLLILISLIVPLVSSCSKSGFSSLPSSNDPYTSISYDDDDKYEEQPDSTEGIDVSDLSDLYNAFNLTHYQSEYISYFNDVGTYDYYRHYQSNYIQHSISIFSEQMMYSYSPVPELFNELNEGLINVGNDYYSFFKRGATNEERIASEVYEEDMELVKENSTYQEDVFTLFNLSSDYLELLPFERISRYKYQITETNYVNALLPLCCPLLINTGHYMTFDRVTIELNPNDQMDYRIRVYASSTQSGKLIDSHLEKEDKPNWYLLFAEARITH